MNGLGHGATARCPGPSRLLFLTSAAPPVALLTGTLPGMITGSCSLPGLICSYLGLHHVPLSWLESLLRARSPSLPWQQAPRSPAKFSLSARFARRSEE